MSAAARIEICTHDFAGVVDSVSLREDGAGRVNGCEVASDMEEAVVAAVIGISTDDMTRIIDTKGVCQSSGEIDGCELAITEQEAMFCSLRI